MKFYHVSTHKGATIEQELIPRIPNNTLDDENKDIPRICLSTSIEGCFIALQYITDKPFILYELDIDENDKALLSSKYLYDNNLVMDALESNEYWYLKPIKAIGKAYTIINYDLDFDFAWSCIKLEDVVNIVSRIIKDKEILTNLLETNKTSYDLYESTQQFLSKKQFDNESDELFDSIADLKYATKKTYKNIKLFESNISKLI